MSSTNEYIFINYAQISYQERVLDSLNKLKQQIETPIVNEFAIHFENYVNRETKMVEENIDQDSDMPIVNGSQGIVKTFTENGTIPGVKFQNGSVRQIGHHSWNS